MGMKYVGMVSADIMWNNQKVPFASRATDGMYHRGNKKFLIEARPLHQLLGRA